jgi:hypothetical protein
VTRGWRRRARRALGGVAVVVLLGACAASCGYRLVGTSSSLPDRIRRIGIPPIENLSQTPDLDRLLTEALHTEFGSRGRFSISSDTTDVQAVLRASIRSVTPEVAAVTGDTRLASSIFIHVMVAVEFTEVNAPPTSEVNWSNPSLRVSEEYETNSGAAGADPATLFAQDRNALERLARKLAQQIAAAVLNRF